ncbi:MAG TPA: GAF domain-containing protein [Candidatus Cybelea sp.]
MPRWIAPELAAAVDNEASREERARAAATLIRDAGGFDRVRIYDVGDELLTLIGSAGAAEVAERRLLVTTGPNGEAVSTRDTVRATAEAVVPILGAESGVVIGTLDAGADHPRELSSEDVAFLEDCAAVLRPLYD